MKRIDKCFIVNGGILVIVEPWKEPPNIKKISAQLGVEERGLVVLLGDYVIPLPEDLLRLYYRKQIRYDLAVERQSLSSPAYSHNRAGQGHPYRGKAVYRYHKSRRGKEKRRIATGR